MKGNYINIETLCIFINFKWNQHPIAKSAKPIKHDQFPTERDSIALRPFINLGAFRTHTPDSGPIDRPLFSHGFRRFETESGRANRPRLRCCSTFTKELTNGAGYLQQQTPPVARFPLDSWWFMPLVDVNERETMRWTMCWEIAF